MGLELGTLDGHSRMWPHAVQPRLVSMWIVGFAATREVPSAPLHPSMWKCGGPRPARLAKNTPIGCGPSMHAYSLNRVADGSLGPLCKETIAFRRATETLRISDRAS